ncbi:MAG: nuclear transport factor 2 family protein [Saonia sp.]
MFKSTFGQSMDTEEKKLVWKVEKKYWGSIEGKDIKIYGSLLHPEFTDWPKFTDDPLGSSEGMLLFIGDLFRNHQDIQADISPNKIRILDLYALVYLTVKISLVDTSGTKKEENFRILHIWHKCNDKWLLLGGMQSGA